MTRSRDRHREAARRRACAAARGARGAALLLGIASLLSAFGAQADGGRDVAPRGSAAFDAIAAAQQRVVKLYGGALGREHGYGSGVIVSPDGRIVTTLSVLLETPALRVVLPDGRRLPARVVRRDERRQLALLEIDAEDLPAFTLDTSEHLRPGDWVIAASNAFKVASGPEPVSITVGGFAGRTQLAARRRAQEFAYGGEALLTDIIVSAPGSAGGALVDLDGRLVGVIGKPVISRRTHTWVNYAVPVEQVRAFLESDSTSPAAALLPGASAPPVDGRQRLLDLGVRLFDVGGQVRLAYVERVRAGSAARRAGLRVDDLILAVNGEPVETCQEVFARIGAVSPDEPVELLVKRGGDALPIDIVPEDAPQ